MHTTRQRGQCTCVHDALTQIGESTFGQVGESAVGDIGNHPTEHGVAEEFKTFVRIGRVVLGLPRPMLHCTYQQRLVGEPMADTSGQTLESVRIRMRRVRRRSQRHLARS